MAAVSWSAKDNDKANIAKSYKEPEIVESHDRSHTDVTRRIKGE